MFFFYNFQYALADRMLVSVLAAVAVASTHSGLCTGHEQLRYRYFDIPYERCTVQVGCNATRGCGDHGLCGNNGMCVCLEEYATLEIEEPPCTTNRKDKILVTVLHVFFGPIGLSAFMLGWNAWGTMQLVCTLVWMCSGCCTTTTTDENSSSILPFCVGCMFAFATLVLYCWTLMCIILHCVDGDGIRCS